VRKAIEYTCSDEGVAWRGVITGIEDVSIATRMEEHMRTESDDGLV